MGQPDGGRAAVGQQALGHQPRGGSLMSQVLAGTARGRVGVERDLPPGQTVRPDWPAQHYGRVPRFRPDTWSFTVMGATESGAEHRWDWAGITRLPRCAVTADLHCVTKCTIPAIAWEGIPATEILSAAPPRARSPT